MGYYKIDDNILNKQYEIKIGSRHYGQMYYGINKNRTSRNNIRKQIYI